MHKINHSKPEGTVGNRRACTVTYQLESRSGSLTVKQSIRMQSGLNWPVVKVWRCQTPPVGLLLLLYISIVPKRIRLRLLISKRSLCFRSLQTLSAHLPASSGRTVKARFISTIQLLGNSLKAVKGKSQLKSVQLTHTANHGWSRAIFQQVIRLRHEVLENKTANPGNATVSTKSKRYLFVEATHIWQFCRWQVYWIQKLIKD